MSQQLFQHFQEGFRKAGHIWSVPLLNPLRRDWHDYSRHDLLQLLCAKWKGVGLRRNLDRVSAQSIGSIPPQSVNQQLLCEQTTGCTVCRIVKSGDVLPCGCDRCSRMLVIRFLTKALNQPGLLSNQWRTMVLLHQVNVLFKQVICKKLSSPQQLTWVCQEWENIKKTTQSFIGSQSQFLEVLQESLCSLRPWMR